MLFAARRAAQHAGQLAVLATMVAVLGGALGAASSLSATVIDTGTARIVSDADPAQQSVVVDAPITADDATIAAAVTQAFRTAPVTVHRARWATAPGSRGPVLLLADPDIASQAALVDGSWPAGDAQVAVAAPAAAAAPTRIDDTPVTVTGTWRAKEVAAVVWAGHPAVASGTADGAAGPVLVSDAFLAAHGHSARTSWTVSAAGPIAADAIAGYRAGLTRLTAALDDLDQGLGIRTSGGWDQTLARAAGAAAVGRGILAVPVALLTVMGALVLGVLARAFGRGLAADIHLLRARGASAGAVVTEVAAMNVAVMAAAGVVAAGIGLAAGSAPGPAVAVAGVVALGAVMLVTAVAATAASAAPEVRGDVSRRGLFATAGAAVVVAIVAGLASWQLVTVGLATDGTADAAAATAPAWAVITGALLIALLAGPVAAGGERLVRRSRGAGAVLALRRIARQASVVVAGVLSLAVAAGSIAFAAVTDTRAQRVAHAEVAHLVGADVRAVYDVSPIVDGSSRPLSAARVDASGADVFAAFRAPISVGQTQTRLVALTAERLAGATGLPAQRIAGGAPLALDGDLELDVVAVGVDGGVHPSAIVAVRTWLVDASGSARQVAAGHVRVDGKQHPLTVPVEPGDALAAVELGGPDAGLDGASVQVITRTGGAPTGTTLTATVGGQTPRARVVVVAGMDKPLPVVITDSLAGSLALRAGDPISLHLGTLARPIEGTVTAVRGWLPGSGAGPSVAVDLDGLIGRALVQGGSVPAVGELWAHTADVAAISSALRKVADRPVQVVTAATIGTAAVIDPMLALVTAGVGLVALLAAAAFVAVAVALVRARRAQAVPLRAFGFTATRQRAAAVIELTATAAFALVGGTAAGILVAAWLGPALMASLSIGGGV